MRFNAFLVVFAVILLAIGCSKMVDQSNNPPKIDLIGFSSDTLTFIPNKSYEFQFKVSDADGDKYEASCKAQPGDGKIEQIKKDSNGLYHAFYTPKRQGLHKIKIVVTDKIETSSIFSSVYFHQNSLPVARFTSIQLGKSIIPDLSFIYEFNPTGSFDKDGEIKRIKWDFNGELIDTTNIPIRVIFHEYDTYKVKLQVFDDLGGKGTADSSIYNSLPVLSISGEQLSSDINDLRVSFSSEIYNNNLPIKSIQWKFGDNKPPSNQQNPIHLYENVGNYKVTCTLEDEIGKTVKDTTIEVTASNLPPVADFRFSIPNGSTTFKCQNLDSFEVFANKSFTRDSSEITEYRWYYKKENGLNLGRLIKNGAEKEKFAFEPLDIGNHLVGLIIISGSGLESQIKWRKFSIENTSPIPDFRTQAVYKPIIGVVTSVIAKSAEDPDPTESFYYRWYVTELGKKDFRYVPEWDNKNPGGFMQQGFWLRLEVEDRHGGKGTVEKEL